jgi:uncharacterized protein YbcI
MSRRISDEISAIHRESYGEEVDAVRTHMVEDLVICVLDIRLLPHERTLLDNGQGESGIRRARKQFQEAIGASFTAAVEHGTGRRVIGFLSETHLDPPFAVEIFRLAPRPRLSRLA